MKIIFKSLLLVLMFMMGSSLITNASMKRANYLFVEEAMPALAEGDVDSYVEKTMVMIGNQKYINKPVHKFQAEGDFSFNFDIYHFQSVFKKVPQEGLQLYLYNFTSDNFINLIDDKEAYEKNKALVSVRIKIVTDIGNKSVELFFPLYEQVGKDEFLQTNGSTANSLYLTSDKDETYFNYVGSNQDEMKISSIKSFQFFVEDRTKTNGEKVESIKIGEIFADNSSEFYEEVKLTGINNTFEASGLKANASEYKSLTDLYTNDALVTTSDFNALKKYNYLVTRVTIFYGISTVIIVFLMFFLKPIQDKLKIRKEQKKELANN